VLIALIGPLLVVRNAAAFFIAALFCVHYIMGIVQMFDWARRFSVIARASSRWSDVTIEHPVWGLVCMVRLGSPHGAQV
jgi:hypothetical protein